MQGVPDHGFYTFYHILYHREILGFAGHGLVALMADVAYGIIGVFWALVLVQIERRFRAEKHYLYYFASVLFMVPWILGCALALYLSLEIKHLLYGTYAQYEFNVQEILVFAEMFRLGISSFLFQLFYVAENTILAKARQLSYPFALAIIILLVYLGWKDIVGPETVFSYFSYILNTLS